MASLHGRLDLLSNPKLQFNTPPYGPDDSKYQAYLRMVINSAESNLLERVSQRGQTWWDGWQVCSQPIGIAPEGHDTCGLSGPPR